MPPDADAAALGGHGPVQDFRLVDSPGEPVQHDPGGRIFHRPAHHLDDQLVRHQRACVHIALGLPSQLRPHGTLATEDVPAGKMQDAVAIRNPFAVRSLAGARCTQQDYSHAYAPLILPEEVNPS